MVSVSLFSTICVALSTGEEDLSETGSQPGLELRVRTQNTEFITVSSSPVQFILDNLV